MSINEIIAIAGFLITIGTIIWRLAVITTKIHKNEESIKRAHERIDKYVEKFETAFEELKREINNIVQTQTRIEDKVTYLLESAA
jgi:hypothetical protein